MEPQEAEETKVDTNTRWQEELRKASAQWSCKVERLCFGRRWSRVWEGTYKAYESLRDQSETHAMQRRDAKGTKNTIWSASVLHEGTSFSFKLFSWWLELVHWSTRGIKLHQGKLLYLSETRKLWWQEAKWNLKYASVYIHKLREFWANFNTSASDHWLIQIGCSCNGPFSCMGYSGKSRNLTITDRDQTVLFKQLTLIPSNPNMYMKLIVHI